MICATCDREFPREQMEFSNVGILINGTLYSVGIPRCPDCFIGIGMKRSIKDVVEEIKSTIKSDDIMYSKEEQEDGTGNDHDGNHRLSDQTVQ